MPRRRIVLDSLQDAEITADIAAQLRARYVS